MNSRKTIAMIALTLVALTNVAQACPTCKLTLESTSGNSDQGYALSILFMITVPFLIFASWSIFIWRSFRAHRAGTNDAILSNDLNANASSPT